MDKETAKVDEIVNYFQHQYHHIHKSTAKCRESHFPPGRAMMRLSLLNLVFQTQNRRKKVAEGILVYKEYEGNHRRMNHDFPASSLTFSLPYSPSSYPMQICFC